MRSPNLVVVLVALVGACYGGPYEPTLGSAKIAHLEPTMRTGAPLEHPIELAGSASMITSATSGGDGSNLTAAKFEVSGELRVRLGPHWDLDAIGGGSSLGSMTFAAGAQYTTPVSAHVRIATALELGGQTYDYTDTQGDDQLGTATNLILGVTEIVRDEPLPHVGLFASVGLHTNPAAVVSMTSPSPGDPGGGVTMYFVGAAGADLRLGRATIAALAYVSTGLGVTGNPIDYGPGFLVSLSFALGH